MNAGLYRGKTQLVLQIDTAKLVDKYREKILLSPINSGCTKPFPHPRGPMTFQTITDFPYAERRKTRPIDSAVVELTVEYSVPDIAKYVIKAEHRRGPDLIEKLI